MNLLRMPNMRLLPRTRARVSLTARQSMDSELMSRTRTIFFAVCSPYTDVTLSPIDGFVFACTDAAESDASYANQHAWNAATSQQYLLDGVWFDKGEVGAYW